MENHNNEKSIIEELIKPAIRSLLAKTEGSYRCERDLHHHFTVCLERVKPLHLGSKKKRVYLERPGKACYGTGRNGNLDYFFPADSGNSGAAVELNFNYRGSLKITRDIQKLIDPQNAYAEGVYFAFGQTQSFCGCVKAGIERAYKFFAENTPDFALPRGFTAFVVEKNRRVGLL